MLSVVLQARSQTEKTAFLFFSCLSAGRADTVAAAQTADSCISLASSICYLETGDFITAEQCSCTPWLSPGLSLLSLRLHVNDCLRLYLIKIWQALSIIRRIVCLCFFLPPSPLIAKSIFNPPAWCPHPSSHSTLTAQALIYQHRSLDTNKVSRQMTPLVDRYTSNKITCAHLQSERNECGELSSDADITHRWK